MAYFKNTPRGRETAGGATARGLAIRSESCTSDGREAVESSESRERENTCRRRSCLAAKEDASSLNKSSRYQRRRAHRGAAASRSKENTRERERRMLALLRDLLTRSPRKGSARKRKRPAGVLARFNPITADRAGEGRGNSRCCYRCLG